MESNSRFTDFQSHRMEFKPRAVKITKNKTEQDTIIWYSQAKNGLNKFCVGVFVGGHHRDQKSIFFPENL